MAHRSPWGLWVVAVIAATLSVAGCASGTSSSQETSAASSAQSATPTGNATVVTIDAKEFSLTPDTMTFKPGLYSFVLKDTGVTVHSLSISGPGLPETTSSSIDAGQSTTLTVMLQAGTYKLWCPIDSHREKGMETSITVKP